MKKIFIYLLFCLLAISTEAQVNEVKLVTSGTGNTRQDAINSALRGAVEQAFGVFVSSNTTILNDQMVKDEIAAISSGNIKSYDVISDITTADGKSNVTVSAVVSVNKLVQYAKAKGASCEFEGTLFGANLRLIELNKKNTKIVYQNMLDLLKSFSGKMVDYDISVSNPQIDGTVTITIQTIANDNTKTIGEILEKTINSITVDWKESKKLQEMGVRMDSWWLPINYGVGGRFKDSRVDSIYSIKYEYGLSRESMWSRYMYSGVVSIEKLQEVFQDGLLNFAVFSIDNQNSTQRIISGWNLSDLRKDEILVPRKEFFNLGGNDVMCAYPVINIKYSNDHKQRYTFVLPAPPFYSLYVHPGSPTIPLTFPFKCPKGTIISSVSLQVKMENLASIKSFNIVPGVYPKNSSNK